MPKKVLIFDAKPYEIEFFDKANKEYNFHLKYSNSRLTEDTVKLSNGYEAICVFVNDIVSGEIIDYLFENNIKLVALRSAGYNNVDFKAAYKKVHVVRVPAYSPYSVAEHAVSLLLTLNRKTHRAFNRVRDNNFSINGLMGFDLHGKTVGVIGTGKIGSVFIKIMKGFGMNILAYDKYPDKKSETEIGFTYVDLETLFRESDVISLNCPLNNETYHMINTDTIQIMKPGVFIINTGRGKLIDTNALIEGLKSKKIGAAGLDVYEEESEYFFEDFSNEIISDDVLARLLTFGNVLITSHQGFFTKEALTNIAGTTLKNIHSYFFEKTIENEICYACTTNTSECKKIKDGKCF